MTTTATAKKQVKSRRIFSSEQKTRAVLEVWTESRKPAQIARELEITTTLLDLWQKRAMKAIMTAMEPREGDPDKEATLSARVERMISRQSRNRPASRLARRLGSVQAAGRKSAVAKKAATDKAPPQPASKEE
jgi:transposase-like protein